MAWKSTDHMMAGCAAAAKSPNTPQHLRAHLEKRAGTKGTSTSMAKPNPKAPLGQGGRFAALAAKTSPAIAASIGRKKYGAKKMEQMATAGKKKKSVPPSDDAFMGR